MKFLDELKLTIERLAGLHPALDEKEIAETKTAVMADVSAHLDAAESKNTTLTQMLDSGDALAEATRRNTELEEAMATVTAKLRAGDTAGALDAAVKVSQTSVRVSPGLAAGGDGT